MEAVPEAAMTASSISRLTVLVVDDNALLRHGLRETLGLWGTGVVLAADGEEAKIVLRRQSIDLVVTDWMMAPMGGAALLRWIRNSPDSPQRQVPVIVLTANTDVATVRTAWESGANAVLAKPVAPPELVRRIETVLGRQQRNNASGEPSPDMAAGRVRLAHALDRLEAAMTAPRRDLLRLTSGILDVERAARGQPGVADIAASLSACLADVGANAHGFLDAICAHLAAFRWVLADGSGNTAVRGSLVACLQATVRALAAPNTSPRR